MVRHHHYAELPRCHLAHTEIATGFLRDLPLTCDFACNDRNPAAIRFTVRPRSHDVVWLQTAALRGIAVLHL
jgi:hypothetical protein